MLVVKGWYGDCEGVGVVVGERLCGGYEGWRRVGMVVVKGWCGRFQCSHLVWAGLSHSERLESC